VAAAAGDHDALRWLLDEVAPIVYGSSTPGSRRRGRRRGSPTGDVDGAVKGASNFRGDASASTWMCAIARRRLSRYYESERRAEVARRSLRVVDDARDSDEVAGTAELVERQDEVVRALGRLPALQRQVLVMKYLETCRCRTSPPWSNAAVSRSSPCSSEGATGYAGSWEDKMPEDRDRGGPEELLAGSDRPRPLSPVLRARWKGPWWTSPRTRPPAPVARSP